MSPRTVDHLNIGLMLFSLVAAFALPFELFLFSYAVLGPLHYLTEISWLHERKYFSRERFGGLALALLALVALFASQAIVGDWHIRALVPYAHQVTFVAFAWAFVFVVFRSSGVRWLAALVVLALVLPFAGSAPNAWLLFGLFVTTILHVCLFTGAFMLYGALKSKSTSAYLACAVFALCCVVALTVPAGGSNTVGTYVRDSYGAPFQALNIELARLFGLGTGTSAQPFSTHVELFTSSGGVIVMRFIAFAYTYHYLNWFSKTSIIGWHKVDRRKLAVAMVIWIASIGLYATSYELGLRWLFFLSFAHVLLEFPLNHMAFTGIGQELTSRVRAGFRPSARAETSGRTGIRPAKARR